MKVRSIFAIIAGATLIGVVSLIVIKSNQQQALLQEEYAEAQLQNVTEKLSQRLTLELEGNMDALRVLTQLVAVKENLKEKDITLAAALDDIRSELQLTDIILCDTKGNGYSSEGKEQKVDFCSYYQRALLGDSSIAISGFDQNSDQDVILFTVPVCREGAVTGVIRASKELPYLKGVLSVDTFRGRESIYLLKRDGTIAMQLSEEATEGPDFLSLLPENDVSYNKIAQTIEQGKSMLQEAILSGNTGFISYNGVKNLVGAGIMVTLPRKQLLSLYQEKQEDTITTLVLLASAYLVAAVLVFISIQESLRRRSIEKLAYHDEITDSMNLNRFRVETIALLHKNSAENYAIIVAAIDRFDYIQEFFGAQEGYNILKYISKIFKENIKSDEAFCRLNTNNFALLLNFHSKDELTNRINYLDMKIDTFDEKERKKEKYELRLHYGIYCIEEKNTEVEMMISRASHALQQIKNDKKQPYEYYSGAMQNRMVDEKEIEDHMNIALEEKEFLVYLQPKYSLHTGTQVGAEALVRWMHPDKGLMYPGRFIGVFEKNGFIVKLDMYILETLCQRLKKWISKGYRPLPLSINISRLNLFDDNFIDNIIAVREKYGIPTNLIQLEIAEEVVSDNVERLAALMERLKKYGFLISMDDFGTGTTSMNTLYNVHVDELKLDRKFLLGAEKTARGKNVIKSIIDMAKRLDIKVVSEGVENKAQAKMLQELGCDMIQGFVFSDPLPIKEYENYTYGPRAGENKIW